MNTVKLTPMMQHYLSVKEQYPDAIVFYRMGDFYEMFFEDAEKASKLLDITLTSRSKKDDEAIPMCGVPVRAVQVYLGKLIDRGVKVAVCDQVEDPATAKGLVKRDVVRVITPGMIVENEFLDEKSNNFLLSVCKNHQTVGVSCIDISTGAFRVSESDNIDDIRDDILRISPKEILLPAGLKTDSSFSAIRSVISQIPVTYIEDRLYDYGGAKERLIGQFKTLTLEGFGCGHLIAGVCAAGALLYYVLETQKQPVGHFTGIETYTLTNFLQVDDISCRNMELLENLQTRTRSGTLISTIDQTVTAMGARLLRKWLRYPLRQIDDIRKRLDAVDEAKHKIPAARLIREHLKSVSDLERLGSRIVMGHANARDLLGLKRSLKALPAIRAAAAVFGSDLFQWRQDMEPLNQLAALIEKAIAEDAPPTLNEGNIIRHGYHQDLDELILLSRDAKGWLANLEAQERKSTGINSLKVRYNKVFGYYIEVSKSQSASVPAHYVRKQTLVNAERYITDELKTFEIKILGAEEKRIALELDIFNDIRKEAVSRHPDVQEAAHFLAQSDVLLNLAEIADANNYCKPEINADGILMIEDGRHPVVEKMITGERFVPNSVRMDNQKHQILIITGPNMAGKSTILRQVALIVLMAHTGAFVPAKCAAIPVTDRIFTRVGALDNLSQGQSTFMVEMQETANILNNATPDSLIIMDEIGRGTSTFDGLSIAWAVAEYLHDLKEKGVKTLFATHYHELTELAVSKYRVKNYNIAVKEWKDRIIFLRKMAEGGTNKSYGIQVARLAGVPDSVIHRAKKILSDIESRGQKINVTPGIAESQSKHRQLNLFGESGNDLIIKKLQNLDVSGMTPLDAINCLNELHEQVNMV